MFPFLYFIFLTDFTRPLTGFVTIIWQHEPGGCEADGSVSDPATVQQRLQGAFL